MVFSSISFLYYFLPCVLILYFIVPKKMKNIVLLVSSILFYFYGEPKYILLMFFTIVSAYIHGIVIGKLNDKKKVYSSIEKCDYYRKLLLISEIFISVFLLFLFKYSDFFIKNINSVFRANMKLLNLALPIGISFYTFQAISYVVDIYQEKVKPQKSILKLALYISFFPQLIAGPIVRYSDIEEQLLERKITSEKISDGIKRFIIGLSKKVLLANNLLALCTTFTETNEKSVIFYWIYAISTCLYIYLDFSGYSDMAIGLAKIFGFKFIENFDYPYISRSITEFWRRWHISLGSWFRDYVYIPLGGNRKGKLKQYRNIFIVWMLTGLWHGANWNFVIWGLYFAIILILEKNFLYEKLKKMPSILSGIYTIFLVMISFIIFSSDTLKSGITNIGGLFGITEKVFCNEITLYYLKSYLATILISIIACTPIVKKIVKKIPSSHKGKIYTLEPIILGCLLIISTGYLIDNSFNPFLYFRF